MASPFIAIIILQLALATFSLQMVTSLRAYVTGESLWSKGQNDAIYFLNRYIDTSNPAYLVRYQSALDVPMGDRDARLALEAQPRDRESARDGFLRGGNHPADVAGLIWVFENFSWFYYMQKAVEAWRNAEPTLLQLGDLATEVAAVENATGAQRQAWKARLDGINDLVRPLTVEFSNTLGQGTRFVQGSLFAANLALATIFVVLTLWRLRNFVRNRRAFEYELSWRASHDDLTKLPNRAAFELAVTQALADGSARALMFVDLDRFKQVNDAAGHAAGDRLLCSVADILTLSMDETALAARLGGDEFAILVRGVSAGHALAIGHRLCSALGDLSFVWKDRHFSIGASIGFVALGRSPETLQSALMAADTACYKAKQLGRNRVFVYGEDEDLDERTRLSA